ADNLPAAGPPPPFDVAETRCRGGRRCHRPRLATQGIVADRLPPACARRDANGRTAPPLAGPLTAGPIRRAGSDRRQKTVAFVPTCSWATSHCNSFASYMVPPITCAVHVLGHRELVSRFRHEPWR